MKNIMTITSTKNSACLAVCTMIVILLTLSNCNSINYDNEAKEYCEQFKIDTDLASSQLPINIDSATTWVGLYSILLNDKCIVKYDFLVNFNKLLYTLNASTEGQINEIEMVNFLNSNDGIEFIRRGFINQTHEEVIKDAKLPHVDVVVKYTFDNDQVHIINFNLD